MHAFLCFSCNKSSAIISQMECCTSADQRATTSFFGCLEIIAPVPWLSCKAVHHCSWVHLHSILWHRAQIVQARCWFSTVKHTFEMLCSELATMLNLAQLRATCCIFSHRDVMFSLSLCLFLSNLLSPALIHKNSLTCSSFHQRQIMPEPSCAVSRTSWNQRSLQVASAARERLWQLALSLQSLGRFSSCPSQPLDVETPHLNMTIPYYTIPVSLYDYMIDTDWLYPWISLWSSSGLFTQNGWIASGRWSPQFGWDAKPFLRQEMLFRNLRLFHVLGMWLPHSVDSLLPNAWLWLWNRGHLIWCEHDENVMNVLQSPSQAQPCFIWIWPDLMSTAMLPHLTQFEGKIQQQEAQVLAIAVHSRPGNIIVQRSAPNFTSCKCHLNFLARSCTSNGERAREWMTCDLLNTQKLDPPNFWFR